MFDVLKRNREFLSASQRTTTNLGFLARAIERRNELSGSRDNPNDTFQQRASKLRIWSSHH